MYLSLPPSCLLYPIDVNLSCLPQRPLMSKLISETGGDNVFCENLKTLRKEKGLSQEELASQLHVVRQTVSKWEKCLSVPDASLLVKLAEILEVSVSTLLGEKVESTIGENELAEQLEKLNAQIFENSRRRKRIIKIVIIAIIAIMVVITILFVLNIAGADNPSSPVVTSNHSVISPE